MLTDGLRLLEGSDIINPVVANGTSFPGTPSTGELFFRSDLSLLYVYDGSQWTQVGLSSNSLNGHPGSYYLDNANATGVLAIANGGTGSTSIASFQSTFGLTPGMDIQVYDADLAAIASLSGTSGLLKKMAANTWVLDTSTYLTANQTIAVTGDVSGTGTTAITTTLATVNSAPGTYGSSATVPVITVNAKGLVTSVSTSAITTSFTVSGDVTGTIDGGTDILTLASVNANVGSFGSTTTIPVITVNAKGLVTSVSTATISGTVAFTGDVTGSGSTGSSTALTLATVNSNVGSFGSATNVGTFTVNAKGLVTAASSTPISVTSTAVSDFTEAVQDVVGLGFIVNGGGITATYADAANTLTLGSTATSANTPSAIVARDASGNFSATTITANLAGNATTATSATTATTASTATLAATATALATARTINGVAFDGTANITVPAAAGTLTGATLASNVVNSSLTSVGTLTNLTVTNPIVGTLAGTASTATTATTATALATARTISLTGDVTATTAAFDGSANVSGVATLATVNSNVGTFSAVTINAKGLATAGANLAVTGDVSGTTSGASLALTLATVNASPVTASFSKLTTNGKGLVTATTPVTSSDLTTTLGYTPVNKAGDTMLGFLTLSTDPTSALHAATKQYVDNVATGVLVHTACHTATTAALTATYSNGTSGVGATLTATANGALGTVGGYASLATGNRVLVKDQASGIQNGIYVVTNLGSAGAAWVLTRASDFDGTPTTEIEAGDLTYVVNGTLAGTQWVQTSIGTGTGTSPVTGLAYNYVQPGTDAVSFTQFSGAGAYTGGSGISIASNVISNTGVLSVTGTANQITASASTGAVTLSLPSTITVNVTGTASGNLPLTGGTVTGALSVSPASGDANFTVNTATSGNFALISLKTGNLNRWVIAKDNTAESGSSAGSNLAINRYDDTGTFLSVPLTINRATGITTIASLASSSLAVTGTTTQTGTINLAGTTSPLQVQGSAGTSGQVLTSAGAGATPTWTTVTAGSAAAGTLTGTTLASNVVASSLTSVGTLTSLTVTGVLNTGDNISSTKAGAIDISHAVNVTSVASVAMGFNNTASTNAYGAPPQMAYFGTAQGFPLVFTTSAGERLRLSTAGATVTGSLSTSGGALFSNGTSLSTSSITTIQIAGGTSELNGIVYVQAVGSNIVHRMAISVTAQQFGYATVNIISENAYLNTLVLSNPRIVTNVAGSTTYLVIDVLTASALTIGIGGFLYSGLLTASLTPGGSTAVTNYFSRLDSQGNLVLGGQTAGAKLDVRGNASISSSTASNPILSINKTDSGTANQSGGALYLINSHAANTARTGSTLAGQIVWQFSQPTSGSPQNAAAISVYSDGPQAGLKTPSYMTFLTTDTTDGGATLERMRIDSAGNTSMSTAGARLVVGSLASTGTGVIVAYKTSADVSIEASSNTVSTAFGTNSSASSNAWGAPASTSFIGNQSAYPLVFTTVGAERMRIDTSGNVGIGGTPTYKLDVISSAAVTARVTTSSTAQANFIVQNSTADIQIGADTTGSFVYTTAAVPMRFITSATERMRIDSSGKVLIGTTTNTLQLNVLNGIRTQAQAGVGYRADFYVNSTSAFINAYNDTLVAYQPLQVTASNYNFSAGTAGGTNAMTISTAGNIGINTATTTEKLNVAGGISIPGPSSIASATGPAFKMDSYVSGTARMLSFGSATTTPGTYEFYQASSDNSVFRNALTIASDGSTNITGTLFVKSTTASTGYVTAHNGTSTNAGYFEFYAGNGNRQGYIGNSSTTGTTDTGSLNYVAGAHAFTGSMSISGAITSVGSITSTGTISGTHSGSGAALTSLNASNITSGTLPNSTVNGGTYTMNITGSAGSATAASSANVLRQTDATTYLTPVDPRGSSGSRTVSLAPNTYSYGLFSEFKSASLFGTAGSYSGLITYANWLGTTASTGDPSYQLLFSPAAANSTAAPTLQIRAGIDTTWGSFSNILHSSNYNSYAPTLSGTGASGTWGISISGSAAQVGGFVPSQANTASTAAVRDSNGDIFARYFNQSSSNSENPTISQVMVTNGSDNYLRKASVAALTTALTGTASISITGLAASETFATVTGRGTSTTSQITVGTTAGGSMITAYKIGASYADGTGAYLAKIDNPTGSSNWYFQGTTNAVTNFQVRADGQIISRDRIVASFNQAASGSGQAGDLITRRSASTGTVYFGDNTSAYLYFDGTNFNFGTGQVNGNFTGTLTGSITGNAATVTSNAARTDTTAYPVVWNTTGGTSANFSCNAVTIQSSTGTLSATTFSGSGSGLTGTAGSLTAGNASSISSAVGGSYTWSGIQYLNSFGTVGNNANSGYLNVYNSAGTGSAVMGFHRSGVYAINMGMDTDNVFRIGGWSDGLNTYRMELTTAGAVTFRGDVTAFSDARIKDNVETIPDALAKVEAIRGVTFTRTDTEDTKKRHAGVIAQEVEEVLPEVVSTNTEGMKTVAYGNMVGLLIEAVKELSAQNKVLMARLEALEGK